MGRHHGERTCRGDGARHSPRLLHRERIGLGVISYAAIKLLSGRFRDLDAAVVIIAIAFTMKLALQ